MNGVTTAYGYGDTNWKDKLTSYDGQSITYDEIGNPLSYRGMTMSWTGRRLNSITNNGTTSSYLYNADGIRTRKTVGSTVTEYFTNGSTILAEKTGSNVLWYIYDSDGEILGFTYNGTPYYYIKNIQGDVYKVVNASGSVVASYTYDAWGKVLSSTGSMAQINSIRYRSYYYDAETGFYYLQSRYYDPETGRFVSSDDTGYLGMEETLSSYNLFAYCGNNPVIGYDPEGAFSWSTFVSGLSIAFVGITAIATVLTAGCAAPALAGALAVTSGVMCVGFGAAEMSEAYSGHNVIRDDLMGGNDLVYNTVRNSAEAVASVATLTVSAASASSSYTSQCFVQGTLVLTADEAIPIETVLAGMQVWAMNPETGEKALKKVVRTFVNESDELIHVHTGDDEIVCTPEHPFYVPTKGWTGAAQLRAGDILVLSNGSYVTVEKIQHEILEDPVKVYNFEVEDLHTYFVGESSVLVHNLCHANSLKTSKKTELYVLKDQDSGAVRKIGETTRGVRRYTRRYYESNNVYMRVLDSGSKRAMHYQQHRLLKTYVSKMGRLPDLNRSLW